jgi:hypothetical protein
VSLAAGTTVDTLGQQVDNGYSAEVAIDLTELGYPSDLGDGAFFFGVTLLDGDSFTPFTDSYGTRTWWYREYEGECCTPWAQLELVPVAVDDDWQAPAEYTVVHNSDNPSQQPRIFFSLPERNQLTLAVYDLKGRLVEKRELGVHGSGEVQVPLFVTTRPAAGLYLYRLVLVDPDTGALRTTLQGKTMVVK